MTCCLVHLILQGKHVHLFSANDLWAISGTTMVMQAILANDAELQAGNSPVTRGKARFLTLEGLDGRTVAARRATRLAKGFEAELGGVLTATQRVAVERAAALTALAEDAKARRLSGDMAITLEDVVRTDNAAARAVRQLGIRPASPAPAPPTLAQYLAERAAAAPVAPHAAVAGEVQAAEKNDQAPQRDGEAPDQT
jgi:hypothetical protein